MFLQPVLVLDVDVAKHRDDAPAGRVEERAQRVDQQGLAVPELEWGHEVERDVDDGEDEVKQEVGEEQGVDGMADLDALVHSTDSETKKCAVHNVKNDGNRCQIVKFCKKYQFSQKSNFLPDFLLQKSPLKIRTV